LSLPLRALSQTDKRRPIVFLSTSSERSYGHLLQEFRAALRSFGHLEGRDVIVEARWADEKLERLPALIADALALKPAVIVTHGSAAVAALQKATSSTPVVFASAGDPVGQGFVASFRKPGANITGIAFNEEIHNKLYELVKLVLPATSRIATLANPNNPATPHYLEIAQSATKALGIELLVLNATNAAGLEPAFVKAVATGAHALVVSPIAPFISLRAQIVELQFKYRLPTFHGVREGVDAGGIASYSFPHEENYRRAAALVDQILKGRSPAAIPVEIPTKYEIAINLKSAQVLGLPVPRGVLLRADKVIE
jgi:putative ABC transport system substrate-binding protein